MNEARKRITEAGTYEVQIFDPRFEALEAKDGDNNRMCAVLPGEAVMGEVIEARLMFTKTIITGGQNRGKPTWQVSAEKLHELGLPRPFNPSELCTLHGAVCIYVVEMEEYDGKTRPVVKFINTHRRDALPPEAANDIWKRLTGGAAAPISAASAVPMRTIQPPTQPAPASPAESDDDVPW